VRPARVIRNGTDTNVSGLPNESDSEGNSGEPTKKRRESEIEEPERKYEDTASAQHIMVVDNPFDKNNFTSLVLEYNDDPGISSIT
jgi:hypothetical protein